MLAAIVSCTERHIVSTGLYTGQRTAWSQVYASLNLPRTMRRSRWRGSGLRVVALARACRKAGFCEADLEMVVFVGLGSNRLEGELVPGVRVGEGLLEEGGDVITGVENQASSLGGEYLE